MLRVARQVSMTLLESVKKYLNKHLSKITFILNFRARHTLKALIAKLDNLESLSRSSVKLNKNIELFLTQYNSKSLRRKWIGFKYRTDQIKTTYPELRVLKEIQKQAEQWKKGESHLKDSKLTLFELDQLHKIAEYTEFADLMIQYRRLAKEMFIWALRDGNDVAPFIEFPNTVSHLIESNLSERIGRMDAASLKIKKGHSKILTLPFEGVDHNILNVDYIIDFKGGMRLSIGQIFKMFKNKHYESGHLEFMKEGIINWNSLKLGSYNAELGVVESIDVSAKKWWKKLPLFKTLSLEKVIDRYGVVPHGGEWIAAASSTRGSLSLDFNNTHAFLEVAIPDEQGSYNIFDFGKFASIFPKNFFEAIKMLCKNSHASIAYPDENVYYTHRENALAPFILDESGAERLMDSIKEDIQASRSTNFVYQIESENCAKWVEHKLVDALGEFNIPHLFWMPLLDTEPNGFVKMIFEFIKKLPTKYQVPVLALLHLPLGAFQETLIKEEGEWVAKSLQKHEFFDHGHIFLPALLNEKKQEESENEKLRFEREGWNSVSPTEYDERESPILLTIGSSIWSYETPLPPNLLANRS